MSLHCVACDKLMADFELRWNKKANEFEELCNKCYNISVDTFNALLSKSSDDDVLPYKGTPSKTLIGGLYADNYDGYLMDEGERIYSAYRELLDND